MAILNFVRIVCLFLKQEREKDCLLLLKQKQEQKQKPAFKKRVPEQFGSSTIPFILSFVYLASTMNISWG